MSNPLNILSALVILLSTLYGSSYAAITFRDTKALGWDPAVKQFAGFVDVDEGKNSLFYWFLESRNDPQNDPVILWLNGGPGCSSLKGMMFVNGPGVINANLSNTFNPYSWNSNASIIYLDQPAGTGLSVVNDDIYNSVQIGRQVYEFLDVFFTALPEYSSQPFHLVGASDAGHYVADIAAEIVSHDDRKFKLASLVIGNGLINSQLQYQYMQPMLCGDGGLKPVLSEEVCAVMDIETPLCIEQINKCQIGEYQNCTGVLDYCNSVTIDKIGDNYFDLNHTCSNLTEQCYPQDDYYVKYMNQKDVLETLGASKSQFQACNNTIADDFSFSGAQLGSGDRNLTTVLNAGFPVLLFAGDTDGTYNWLGVRAVALSVAWKGQDEFVRAKGVPWIVGDKNVAEVVNYDTFTFARIHNSGHLVSYDQPAIALKLINTWMSGNWALVG